LAFKPGLNVLTGETGAGKSILLDALGLRPRLARSVGRSCARGPTGARCRRSSICHSIIPARAILIEAGLGRR
jgi:DNA repair protein RecN (Recombination protein N)